MTTPEDTELGLYIDYRTLYGEKELRTIADRIANTINDLELDQEWDDEETVMLAFGEFMNSKYFKALITLHTQEAETKARINEHSELWDIVPSFAEHVGTVKEISDLRVLKLEAHLTNPTEEGEL